MALAHEQFEAAPAPSSVRNCGSEDYCALARLSPGDEHEILLECALATAQQVADETEQEQVIRAIKRETRAQHLPVDRQFAAISCGHLAAGEQAICHYRVDSQIPPK